MEQVFTPGYAHSVATDLVLASLGGRSAQQAIDDGVAPDLVWEALCEATDQPESARWLHRAEPGKRRR